MALIARQINTWARRTGVGPVLASCVLLAVGAARLEGQTLPGTVIRNGAAATYQASTGASFGPIADTAAVTVGSISGIAVLLTKNVDRSTATLGDVLTYTLSYQALGSATASTLVISDVLPAGVTYVPASLTLGGAPLSDATGDDVGEFDVPGGRVLVTIASITGGDAGAITFRARVNGTASPVNLARADYVTPLGADSAASNAVQTTLIFASLSVSKLLDSPASARVGDAVLYRIRYDNPAGGAIARNVVVIDTLPGGLQYVSATPSVVVSGSVLTWALGDIAAGTISEIALQTQVSATLPDSVTVINGATLLADNGPSAAASAPSVLLQLAGTGLLSLEKAADLLEVSLGETVPYTLTLENTGATALSDIRISDHLPKGSRYAKGSALGADSVSDNGQDLTFYVTGPLAPGATYRVRYRVAVVSADRDVLENTAVATAEAGLIQSQVARAAVRVRLRWPLETRAAIGKVFVDFNRNGQQDRDEPGVPNVDVWTDDGEIATTDNAGRFSFPNLRTGRHAYRVDPTTLPVEYSDAGGAQIVSRDGGGWNTPRVNFALVPDHPNARRAGALTSEAGGETATDSAGVGPEAGRRGAAREGAVRQGGNDRDAAGRMAVPVRFTARPVCGSLDGVIPGGTGDRAGIAYFFKNDSRPHYVLEPAEIGRRIRAHLVDRPECGVEVVGHADTSDVHGGPFWTNQRLADERARWVGYELRFTEMKEAMVRVIGHGDREPFVGMEVDSLARNRRVELRLVHRRGGPSPVEYEAVLTNPYGEPLLGLALTFDPPADAVLTAGGIKLDRLRDGRWVVPALESGDSLALRARAAGWAGGAGRARGAASITASSGTVYSRAIVAPVHNPLQPINGMTDPIAILATAAPAGSVPERVSVPPLRSAADRAADARGALTAGPGVTVFAPGDGAVLATDRVFVGVRGEPRAAVALFDGATLVAQAEIRGDGVHDFIAVPLSRGPHRLRVRMRNSWGQERWDSLHVHVSGRPARYVAERSRVVLSTDAQRIDTVRVRMVDEWGVPVTSPAYVTVSAHGAGIANLDEDGSSVGAQVRGDTTGWLTLLVRGGREVRLGSLSLRSGDAAAQLPLEILPAARPLMMTAVGQVGVGASPEAFGAATARGSLDERTTVLVSIDSRQLDAGREDFGRTIDPQAESQYPILGDASSARSQSASRYALAARIERGLDWFALGDLSTGGFAGGLALAGYDRALSGFAGRFTTGAVVWQGFGSTSSERLAQLQIRGQGMSGPYEIGQTLRPGTERVAIETRALENAQRTLARQVLSRYADYQIDYEQGLLLMKQPVPATDVSGNPMFIVVTYAVEDGGPMSAVWGLRASADARGLLAGGTAVDSLRFGSTFISDGRPGAERQLAGLDLALVRFGRASLRAELAHSQSPDSAGFATDLEGSVTLANGRLSLSAGWLHADDEFHNPAKVALLGGGSDLRLGARFASGGREVRLEHSAQRFVSQDASRMRSGAYVSQTFGTFRADASIGAQRFTATGTGETSQAGELKLTWTPLSRLDLWLDGRHHLGSAASAILPDYLGSGARVRISPHTSLEVNHRQVALPNGPGYSVTTLGGRSHVGFGTDAWGSYQMGGTGEDNTAALVGLNNRLRIGSAWTMNAMLERRMGLNNAPAADPVRALPFVQSEEDYWSAALGAEFLPAGAPYRFSLRGEVRDGEERSSRLLTMAGEASLSESFALLSRTELIAADDYLAAGTTTHRRFSSLNGVAFRPAGSDALNFLAKVELIDSKNPLGGGVLTTQTGEEARRIFTAEAIWSPAPWAELGARLAVRRTEATVTHPDSMVQPLSSSAEYAGTSLYIGLLPILGLRAEGRLLHEGTSGSTRWDAAPQLVLRPVREIELATGYRLGDLRDPDFAVRGGAGWFLTLGATLTEQSAARLVDFWRQRWSR